MCVALLGLFGRLLVSWRSDLSWASPEASQTAVLWCVDGRGRGAGGVRGQWASLDRRALPWSSDCLLTVRACGLASLLNNGFLGLCAAVVVGELDADLAGILAFAVQAVPVVAGTTTWGNDGLEVDPRLANQLRLLVVVEDGHFEAVVVGRVVDGKAQFLIPKLRQCLPTRTEEMYSPLGCLPTALVGLCFLRLLS